MKKTNKAKMKLLHFWFSKNEVKTRKVWRIEILGKQGYGGQTDIYPEPTIIAYSYLNKYLKKKEKIIKEKQSNMLNIKNNEMNHI